eukprot:10160716-Alexandrium_andersonii.AAC.1
MPLADRPTNNSAELAAILLALRCLSGVPTRADIEVMSDSKWAIGAAQRDLTPSVHSDLAAWTAAL